MRNRNELISIVAQAFYGNRTGTEISRENVGYFLKGYVNSSLLPRRELDVDISYVLVSGTDNVVIVYDKNQEDEYINKKFPEIYSEYGADYKERNGEEMKPYICCEIPQTGLKIHTRCFACRIDENGRFTSLEEEDIEKFIHYFPER